MPPNLPHDGRLHMPFRHLHKYSVSASFKTAKIDRNYTFICELYRRKHNVSVCIFFYVLNSWQVKRLTLFPLTLMNRQHNSTQGCQRAGSWGLKAGRPMNVKAFSSTNGSRGLRRQQGRRVQTPTYHILAVPWLGKTWRFWV